NKQQFNKQLLLTVMAITCVLPLVFVSDTVGNRATDIFTVNFLAKIGSLVGTMFFFWQIVIGTRRIMAKFIPDLAWLITLHKKLGRYGSLLVFLHPTFITVYYLIV